MNFKNKKIKSYLLGIFLISIISIYFGNVAFAQVTKGDSGGSVSSPTTLTNPLGDSEDMKNPNIVIGKIINSVLGVVGTIALAMFIYGGFRWMTSGGGDGVKDGKETIVWATLGLVVIFMAYAVVNFVIGNILLGK